MRSKKNLSEIPDLETKKEFTQDFSFAVLICFYFLFVLLFLASKRLAVLHFPTIVVWGLFEVMSIALCVYNSFSSSNDSLRTAA